jgi:membrane-bound ClpP family serine protease
MARDAAPWLLLALALAVAGAVLYVMADGLVETLSIGIFGVAGVVAVSGLFYAVGVSEDRDRARERGRARGRRG